MYKEAWLTMAFGGLYVSSGILLATAWGRPYGLNKV